MYYNQEMFYLCVADRSGTLVEAQVSHEEKVEEALTFARCIDRFAYNCLPHFDYMARAVPKEFKCGMYQDRICW